MKVCRVCLAMRVKMYPMSEHKLSIMYERVTGVEVNTKDKLPKMLCWECVARLSTANNFVQKALKTQWILLNKINSSRFITLSDIESIDKDQYQIGSTLGFKYYNENDSNLLIIDDTSECNNENAIELTDFDERESELNDSNVKIDIVLNNEEEDLFMPQVSRHKEKDPIKIEFDVEVEGNAYDEDNDDKDDIKFETQLLEISIKQNVSDEEVTFDSVSDLIEAFAEESKSHRKSPRVMAEDIMLSEIKHNIKDSLRKLKRNDKSVKKKSQIKAPKYKNPRLKKLRATSTVKKTYTENEASSKQAFICDICGKSLQKKNTLIRHIFGHSSVFKCTYCTYKTYRSDRLSVHINSKHTKTISFDCTYCDYVTYRKTCLTEHINSKHTENFPYHCSHCSYKTCRKSNLTKHINGKHTKTINFYCSYCNYKTFHKSTLDRHINCTHTKKNVFKCSFCNFEAHRKYILSAHINSKHTKNISFDCSHCNFKTYQKGNLNAHVKYAHTKSTSFECPFCSYKTCVKSNCRKHVKAVHNNISSK